MVESIQPLVEVTVCNDADINWYVRMPIGPYLIKPKVEMLLELCREDVPEPTYATKDNQLPY